MKNKILIILVIVLVVFGVVLFLNQKNNLSSVNTGEGQRCGGNMANAPVCANGYHCAPVPGSHLPFGDVGGTCVKD